VTEVCVAPTGRLGSFATSSSLGPPTDDRMGVVGNNRSDSAGVRSGGVKDRASVSAVYCPLSEFAERVGESVGFVNHGGLTVDQRLGPEVEDVDGVMEVSKERELAGQCWWIFGDVGRVDRQVDDRDVARDRLEPRSETEAWDANAGPFGPAVAEPRGDREAPGVGRQVGKSVLGVYVAFLFGLYPSPTFTTRTEPSRAKA